MIDRRTFLGRSAVGAGVAIAVGTGAMAKADAAPDAAATNGQKRYGAEHVNTVTAVTQVFGSGQKCIAAVLEFDQPIVNSRLSVSSFTVAGRTVDKVYANRDASFRAQGRDGRFVVIELSPNDPAALLWVSLPMTGMGGGPPQVGNSTPGHKIVPASLTVTQAETLQTTGGLRYFADSTTSLISTETKNLIVDDFKQFSYADPTTGRTLTYNLYIPENYDPKRRYPLVLFMHDAGVVAVPTLGPLVQGTGAVVWASPQDQAKHPCFVLAPEYPEVVIGDDYLPSTYFEATVNLLKAVANEYSIDHSRLYSTGQSMGAMLTLGINIKYPGLLAASYVVAGQWPDDQATPLAKAKLWVTVSEGDTKAFPMENAIMKLVRSLGTKVAEASWDAASTPAEFAANVKALLKKQDPINYAHFKIGTLPGTQPGGSGNEHTSTWQVAYGIPSIRDWIMKQSL